LKIVHITSHKDWTDATHVGQYVAPSLKSDGFIHCSTFTQVLPVAEKYYKGQSGLVLLVIDPARLTCDMKWEAPAEGTPPPGVIAGEMFPHIYGPVNLDAVVQTLDFPLGPNDHFVLPSGLLADTNS
jgi:uncharacterized protein (DUF952 family)